MMATTHAAAGVLAMVPLLYVGPEFAVPAALGAVVGGVVLSLPGLLLFGGSGRAVTAGLLVVSGEFDRRCGRGGQQLLRRRPT